MSNVLTFKVLTIEAEIMEKILDHFKMETAIPDTNKWNVVRNMRGYIMALYDFEIITQDEVFDLISCLLTWTESGIFIEKYE